MAEFIMVACDLHDKTMVLKIARGREAAEKVTAANTSAGRVRLIEQLRERSRAAEGARVIFAYEASGQGFGWYDELTTAHFECHVLAPTKIARSTQHRQRKTDEKDADRFCNCSAAMCWPATRCRACGFPMPRRATIGSWFELDWTLRKKAW